MDEGSSDESVRRAENLADNNFLSAILEFEPDGISDNEEDAKAKEQTEGNDTSLGNGEESPELFEPLVIELNPIGFRQGAEFVQELGHGCGIRSHRAKDDHGRKRVAGEGGKSVLKPTEGSQLLEAILLGHQYGAEQAGILFESLGEFPGSLVAQFGLQEERDLAGGV